MRIRKNAKLSSILGISSPSHVCQLNQSPWDVIPFSSHDPFIPEETTSSFHQVSRTASSSISDASVQQICRFQLDGDDSLTGNASFGDSLSGIEMAVDDEDYNARSWKQGDNDNNDNEDEDDTYNYGDNNTAGERTTRGLGITRVCCKRTNGKGRQCSREAKGGHYLCERHLKPRHNTNIVINSQSESPASSTRKDRRGRPPKRGPHPGGNNSNQFYYYSGFGPSWGRRRTERGGNIGGGQEQSRMETEGESSGRSSGTPPPLGRVSGEVEGADYAAVYDEDEESSGGERKRTRKPVKARSLKSLM